MFDCTGFELVQFSHEIAGGAQARGAQVRLLIEHTPAGAAHGRPGRPLCEEAILGILPTLAIYYCLLYMYATGNAQTADREKVFCLF